MEQYLKTQNNLTFTADVKLALKDCDIIFIAVNTPTKKSGLGSDWSLDISYIDASVRTIANFDFHKRVIIVEKSTVPVKTCDYIKAILKNKNFCVVSNPEFLAEGNAIKDLLEPDRVIIGGTDGI